MNSKFGYTGKVTLKTICNDKVITTDYYNKGTSVLFRAYAMAMAGQDITNWLPSYIDLGTINTPGGEFNSVLRHAGGVSVLRTFVDDPDNPFTRITVTLTNDMLSHSTGDGLIQVRLMSPVRGVGVSSNNILAELTLNDNDSGKLKDTLANIPNGTQIIILWDLYVKNQEVV